MSARLLDLDAAERKFVAWAGASSLKIVVVGDSGAGVSTVANAIVGDAVFRVRRGSKGSTTEPACAELQDRERVLVVDTPSAPLELNDAVLKLGDGVATVVVFVVGVTVGGRLRPEDAVFVGASRWWDRNRFGGDASWVVMVNRIDEGALYDSDAGHAAALVQYRDELEQLLRNGAAKLPERTVVALLPELCVADRRDATTAGFHKLSTAARRAIPHIDVAEGLQLVQHGSTAWGVFASMWTIGEYCCSAFSSVVGRARGAATYAPAVEA